MSRYRDRVLQRAVGRAIHHYSMIEDGDRIAVGLSGGKDSLTLLWTLQERQARIPITYTFIAIYIDLGFEPSPAPLLEAYCRKMDFPLKVIMTDYGLLGHGEENRENPCFLCARLRRKRLFELAHEEGCNKLALGHNKDDFIETLFLNMCYAGEMSTMVPYQPFFGGELVVIRPLVYVEESAVERYAQDHAFPVFTNPCPSAGTSKRREIKDLLNALYRSNKKIRGNIFRAMSHVNSEYLLKPFPK